MCLLNIPVMIIVLRYNDYKILLEKKFTPIATTEAHAPIIENTNKGTVIMVPGGFNVIIAPMTVKQHSKNNTNKILIINRL